MLIQRVSDLTGVPIRQLLATSGTRQESAIRHFIWALMYDVQKLSYMDIQRLFMHEGKATLEYGVKRGRKMVQEQPQWKELARLAFDS